MTDDELDRLHGLEQERDRLKAALRLKMDEYKAHDPGYCKACDVARELLGEG